MNRSALLLAALALPLLGLGGLWLQTDRIHRQGTEWDVPVQGFDPRDFLQGHYVQYRYDWPGFDPSSAHSLGDADRLCLIGTSPRLDRVERGTQPCNSFVRKADWQGGRLYASQAEAARLQRKLQDTSQQATLRIRVRNDGHATPLKMSFLPRPNAPLAAE